MTDWTNVIRKIAPKAVPSIVKGLSAAMPQVIQIASLNTPLRQAHFLAQLAHESGGFRTATEYASGKAYEGRKDLGNTQPGDGVRYKGRGLIQITGRANYRAMGKLLGQDFEGNPKLAAEFPWAALTAAEYWKMRNINKAADKDDIKAVTRLINGGYNGLEDRKENLIRAEAALKATAAPVAIVDIRAAQKRLAELSYPLGSIDGKAGPLTRSAVRDFQDSAGLPVTGVLDPKTYALLLSPDAPHRPVSSERANIDADTLKKLGSTTVSATSSIKDGVATASAALAGASGVASQINDASSQVDTVTEAIKNGHENFSLLKENWHLALIGILIILAVYCLYKCWKYADIVEKERVRQAQTGENVRI